jgi:hypothetical protein
MANKKKVFEELENVEQAIETKVEEFKVKQSGKKSYKVVLVVGNKVLYEVSPDSCTSTDNIWGNELKPGDIIYI